MSNVGIFWDIDAFSPSFDNPVGCYQTLAAGYGSLDSICAYAQDAQSYPELDESPIVSVIDMFVYAMRKPALATLILISNAPLLAYAVSTLRLRKYRIVVVGSSEEAGVLKSRASEFKDWDVLTAHLRRHVNLESEDYSQDEGADPRHEAFDNGNIAESISQTVPHSPFIPSDACAEENALSPPALQDSILEHISQTTGPPFCQTPRYSPPSATGPSPCLVDDEQKTPTQRHIQDLIETGGSPPPDETSYSAPSPMASPLLSFIAEGDTKSSIEPTPSPASTIDALTSELPRYQGLIEKLSLFPNPSAQRARVVAELLQCRTFVHTSESLGLSDLDDCAAQGIIDLGETANADGTKSAWVCIGLSSMAPKGAGVTPQNVSRGASPVTVSPVVMASTLFKMAGEAAGVRVTLPRSLQVKHEAVIAQAKVLSPSERIFATTQLVSKGLMTPNQADDLYPANSSHTFLVNTQIASVESTFQISAPTLDVEASSVVRATVEGPSASTHPPSPRIKLELGTQESQLGGTANHSSSAPPSASLDFAKLSPVFHELVKTLQPHDRLTRTIVAAILNKHIKQDRPLFSRRSIDRPRDLFALAASEGIVILSETIVRGKPEQWISLAPAWQNAAALPVLEAGPALRSSLKSEETLRDSQSFNEAPSDFTCATGATSMAIEEPSKNSVQISSSIDAQMAGSPEPSQEYTLFSKPASPSSSSMAKDSLFAGPTAPVGKHGPTAGDEKCISLAPNLGYDIAADELTPLSSPTERAVSPAAEDYANDPLVRELAFGSFQPLVEEIQRHPITHPPRTDVYAELVKNPLFLRISNNLKTFASHIAEAFSIGIIDLGETILADGTMMEWISLGPTCQHLQNSESRTWGIGPDTLYASGSSPNSNPPQGKSSDRPAHLPIYEKLVDLLSKHDRMTRSDAASHINKIIQKDRSTFSSHGIKKAKDLFKRGSTDGIVVLTESRVNGKLMQWVSLPPNGEISTATSVDVASPFQPTVGVPVQSGIGLTAAGFTPLINLLNDFKSAGISAPLCAVVSRELLRDIPSIFLEAGCKHFLEYAHLAEHAGVITLQSQGHTISLV
ncbi:hypothetical protein HWV62_11834 [Athelia sp. TMB]|nr:hypothetical protein HWV62_11834 [Athelia sp. TMB]